MPSSAVTVNENGVPAVAVFGATLIRSGCVRGDQLLGRDGGAQGGGEDVAAVVVGDERVVGGEARLSVGRPEREVDDACVAGDRVAVRVLGRDGERERRVGGGL